MPHPYGSSLCLLAGYGGSILAFRGALIRAFLDAGLSVNVVAPGDLSADDKLELERLGVGVVQVPLRRTGTNPVADLIYLLSVYRILRRLRPGYVLPYTIKPVIYGTLAAWLARVPRRYALITGLGYTFAGGKPGLVKRIVQRLYALALARTGKVFFQNPDDDMLFRQLGILHARVPSVVVNGSGVDVSDYTQAPLPSLSPVFLLIARLLGDKGIREYAAAAYAIKKRYPQVRFLLVGWIDENPDAIGHAELDRWIKDGVIEFLGKLSDVRPAIAEATVFVLPSCYREGTPRTVLEAMAMGRPIVTTDAPGCRETVIDGQNGYLVSVRSADALVEAMTRFIEVPELAARMGARSRQLAVEKYDVNKVNAVMLREMGIAMGAQTESMNG